jgi:hypothetical protein
MEIPEMLIIAVTMILSIVSFSSTIIGLSFSYQNEIDVKNGPIKNQQSWKDTNMTKFNFLIINLVVSIVVLLLSIVALFLKFRS